MKIIDFEKKGNVVRFWLGDDDCDDYTTDDIGDYPYECNAGRVYNEYIRGYKDIYFPFDWDVCEPCDGVSDSGYSKLDMKNMIVPCIAAAPEDPNDWWHDFPHTSHHKDVKLFYFNDHMEPDHKVKFENYNKMIIVDEEN